VLGATHEQRTTKVRTHEKNTIETASLRSDSPPTIAFRVMGAPACENTARVATVSVEEIRPPKESALAIPSGKDSSLVPRKYSPTPMMIPQMMVPRKAKIIIATICR